MNKICENSRKIEPLRNEADKEFQSGNPRRDLCQLFDSKDKLKVDEARITRAIHAKVAQILQREYSGGSGEVKESILRVNEQLNFQNANRNV